MIDRLQHFLRAGLFFWLVALGPGTVQGAVPQLLNHQGRVAVNGVNFDGNGQFKFALVSADGLTTYWSNDGSSTAGSLPASHVTLPVAKGLYSVLLGDTALTNMTALTPSALDYDVVRLRIWFNDGINNFQLITPDQRLVAAPYALLAAKSTSATGFDGQLAGEVTGPQGNTTISTAAVTGKALTGFASGVGPISATDTILSAINKLNGNNALKANSDTPTIANPTFTGTVGGLTKSMVSLGNVDNTSDADKPVSTAQLAALNAKAPLASPTFTGTVGGLTKSMVGLGNVTDTSDVDKPVSTAQLAALNAKAPLASPIFTGTVALPAGSTTAAPLRLTAGTNLTAATLGSVEFDGNNLYLTTNAASPTRKTVALSDTGSSSQIGLSSVVAAPLYPVVAWGSNSEGQTRPPVLANVAAVAAGDSHSIALLDDGQVVEWGLSVGTKPTLTGVTDIAAGGSHNLVRQSNGRVLAWGNNTYGQATAPTDIVTAVKVAAGSRHSLALLANGTVRGWGEDYLGKNAAPASLTNMIVIAIAAGENHSLALKNTGEVVAWGYNAVDVNQTVVPVGAQSGVTAIAAGWNHNLALKSDGSVLAWGLNNGGQSTVPAAASSGVVQIAAGDTYSMALKADGTIVTWGFTAGFTAVEDPVTVVPDGTTQVTQIAAGANHALALRADSVPVQLARLDSAGRLGIGRTPLLNALEVEGNASKSVAGSWLANSDRRIKTEIESITGALEKLDQVRLVDFRYTDDYLAAHPGIEDRRYPNVIAQEFQQVFPDDVKSSGETLPDGSPILQVDTYPLTIYSAAAVQELHRENQVLKRQLADQERQFADQEARLRKLEAILENR
jgi:alpha-tubulin suppressor-like RCC1 family protein